MTERREAAADAIVKNKNRSEWSGSERVTMTVHYGPRIAKRRVLSFSFFGAFADVILPAARLDALRMRAADPGRGERPRSRRF
jgi:hypothetical protein